MEKTKEMKTFVSQKGISLVALIVTIIVMVILAGIIIVSAVADGGIIDRAQTALIEQERAEAQDIIETSYVYKTTASQATYKYLDIPKTAEAIFQNLTTAGFELKKEDGTEATEVAHIYSGGDTLELNIQGKRAEYQGTVEKTMGLNNDLKVKENVVEEKTKIKTLNDNFDDFKEAFDEGFYFKTWSNSIVQSAKLAYTNGSENIKIYAGWNDTIPSALNIYLEYTNNNSEKFSYACSITGSPRGSVEDAACAGTLYPYVEKGKWQMFKGNNFSDSAGYGQTAPIYEDFEGEVIFVGDWEIDEDNSNDLGKQYFEKVLIDIK